MLYVVTLLHSMITARAVLYVAAAAAVRPWLGLSVMFMLNLSYRLSLHYNTSVQVSLDSTAAGSCS